MTTKKMIPESCDYLVVGAGATGMSFVDTLLKHYLHRNDDEAKSPCVVLVDQHSAPGGQWQDSYEFVRLHQPSSMYGVETEKLETDDKQHRATRLEILSYYDRVRQKLEENYNFHFVGETTFDVSQFQNNNHMKEYTLNVPEIDGSNKRKTHVIRVEKRVVDARFLEPDLPVLVPPKFTFDANEVDCLPVNALVQQNKSENKKEKQYFVVIGGGKTGMDAVVYLLTQKPAKVNPSNILWVVPNEAWITARENIGSCMELLHTSTVIAKKESDNVKEILKSPQFLQNAFLEWERQGKIYRMHEEMPTKFKDATLSKDELELLQKVPVLRRRGRIQQISNNGDLIFVDGSTYELPWKFAADNNSVVDTTLFVHCSAGAFNYTQHPQVPSPPIFAPGTIIIQDVYGTPGFCFVGSMIARMECLSQFSDEEKNQRCLSPQPDSIPKDPLGPSGGDVTGVSKDHGFVQRFMNLKRWLEVPEIRSWLYSNRLFNLKHLDAEKVDSMVKEIEQVLTEGDVI